MDLVRTICGAVFYLCSKNAFFEYRFQALNTCLMLIFWGIFAALLLLGVGAYYYLYRLVFVLPENRPEVFLKNPAQAAAKKRVVLAGDSLTHGNMSYNYLDILEERLPAGQYHLINAGVNADLAHSLLQRLDEIIACQPDFVCVLVGTNDAIATEGDFSYRRYHKLKNLPQKPDLAWYEENLRQIVRRLRQETQARIALLSIPVLTEDWQGRLKQKGETYIEVIKKIAKEENIVYLPLYEKMLAYLEAQGQAPRHRFSEKHRLIEFSMAKRHLLGQSWDSITRQHGFQLSPDFMHLNRPGAEMIATLVEGFIQSTSS